MERTITQSVKKDLEKKIVIITGPRQVGKTTLSRSLTLEHDYFNYDRVADRLELKQESWDRKKQLVVFDELHKMNQWKRWLKGIYDTEGVKPQLLVTGSAKISTYRKVGDSLAGRYFQYRLHPFALKEVKSMYASEDAFQRLWECGGFPEPFINGSRTFYQRWKKTHTDIILRQDLIDITNIRDIQAVETLIELLRNNVGSTISYANLARSLEKDAKTIKNWLQLLEDLYVIFAVTPYSKKINRSLLKEPKYYFYDSGCVVKDNGAKLENIVAASLLKELHFLEDTLGVTAKLHFARNKEGMEVDFVIVIDAVPSYLIEVKYSDSNPSKGFFCFEKYFPKIKKIQLIKEIKREQTFTNGLEIRDVVKWLSNISLL